MEIKEIDFKKEKIAAQLKLPSEYINEPKKNIVC